MLLSSISLDQCCNHPILFVPSIIINSNQWVIWIIGGFLYDVARVPIFTSFVARSCCTSPSMENYNGSQYYQALKNYKSFDTFIIFSLWLWYQLIKYRQEEQHGVKGSLINTQLYSLQCYIFIVQWVMPPHREIFSRF